MRSKRALLSMAFFISAIVVIGTGFVVFELIGFFAESGDDFAKKNACRLSNAVKFGLESATSGFATSTSACQTIQKETTEKKFVPSEPRKYSRDSHGAYREVADMMIDCNHMFLDGQQENVFSQWPGSQGCFVCYSFRFSEDLGVGTKRELAQGLNEPYLFAQTEGCNDDLGGQWVTDATCPRGETDVVGNDVARTAAGDLCCIKKDPTNVCENRGGACRTDGNSKEVLNPEWSCPGSRDCYVPEDRTYSYLNYLREGDQFGLFRAVDVAIAGEEFDFLESSKSTKDGEVYAISFVSPSSQYCFGDSVECTTTTIGTATAGAAGIALGGFVLFKAAAIAGVPFLVGTATSTLTNPAIAGSAFFGYETGAFERGARSFYEYATGDITNAQPNIILFSTLDEATNDYGCSTAEV